jgi:hypothetical protein
MMERFREILLAVWREACQHIEINESISGIAELLTAHVPLDFMTVERIVPEHGMIATVAAAPHQPPSGMAASRECTPVEMKAPLRRRSMFWRFHVAPTTCASLR